MIEFGGDHLDQLMDASLISNPAVRDIVAKSAATLRQCQRVCRRVFRGAVLRGRAQHAQAAGGCCLPTASVCVCVCVCVCV